MRWLATTIVFRARSCRTRQETTEAPAKAASTAPARKKKRAAPRQDERAATHQDEKARPKTERDATRAPSRAKAAKPEVQERPVEFGRGCASAGDAPPAAEAERKDNPAPAVAAWPPAPASAGTSTPVTAAERAPAPALAAGVATVDPNEVNELDLAAAAPAPAPAEVVLDQISAGDSGCGAGGCIHGEVPVRLISCVSACAPRVAHALKLAPILFALVRCVAVLNG